MYNKMFYVLIYCILLRGVPQSFLPSNSNPTKLQSFPSSTWLTAPCGSSDLVVNWSSLCLIWNVAQFTWPLWPQNHPWCHTEPNIARYIPKFNSTTSIHLSSCWKIPMGAKIPMVKNYVFLIPSHKSFQDISINSNKKDRTIHRKRIIFARHVDWVNSALFALQWSKS